jgi:predicted Kef-type K+ transport protein
VGGNLEGVEAEKRNWRKEKHESGDFFEWSGVFAVALGVDESAAVEWLDVTVVVGELLAGIILNGLESLDLGFKKEEDRDWV